MLHETLQMISTRRDHLVCGEVKIAKSHFQLFQLVPRLNVRVRRDLMGEGHLAAEMEALHLHCFPPRS